MTERKTYTYEELTRGDFLATRGFDVFERFEEYQTKLAQRLRRATTALDQAGIPYAVVGGNAVAAWVASVDAGAVRTTQDVDILLRREDLPAAIKALEPAGFIYKHVASLDFFIDGPNGTVREGIHIIFAGEKVRPEYDVPAPEITEVHRSNKGFLVTNLEAIVRMKLTSHRLKDRVHLQDMIGVGLINNKWPEKFPPPLADRLIHLLQNPEE